MTPVEPETADRHYDKKMTRRQKWIGVVSAGLVLVFLVGGGLASGWLVWPSANAESGKTNVTNRPVNAPPVLTAIRIRRDTQYQRTAVHSGTVRSARHTLVSFQRGGLVTRVLVEEGESVAAGQPVAELDRRHLQGQSLALTARLEQARARLAELRTGPRSETIAAAEANVEDLNHQLKAALLRLERSDKLLQSSAIAQQDYEEELYAVRGLEARLKTATSQRDELLAGTRAEVIAAQESLETSIAAELQVAGYQLDDCLVTAPFDGIIVRRMIDPGAVVAPGTPVVELIDDRHLEFHTGVSQETALRLVVGREVHVVAGSHGFPAGLRTVLPAVDTETQTRRAIFDIQMDPGEPAPGPVDGQMAVIQLEYPVAKTGFWIPAAAITADYNGLWSCLTLDPEKPTADSGPRVHQKSVTGVLRKQSVEILHQQAEWLFVRGTLQDGQLLVTEGRHRVVSGQRATVTVDPAGPPPAVSPLTYTSFHPHPELPLGTPQKPDER